MTGVQSFGRVLLALIAGLLLVFSAGACRKRAQNNNGKGNSLTAAGNSEEAQRNAQALVDQAKELYKNDEDERAAQVLEQAIKLDPNNAEAHLRLGMSYAALDRKPESDDEYKKAVELFKRRSRLIQRMRRHFSIWAKPTTFFIAMKTRPAIIAKPPN